MAFPFVRMMEIDPGAQARMLLASLLLGLAFGLVRVLVVASRTLLGADLPPAWAQALYLRPLPLLHRGPRQRRGKGRRVWRFFVTFFGDCLFCLCFSLSLVLLLYHYNDGAWRLSVPVAALLGFVIFRVCFARVLARLNGYFGYFLAVFWLYLRTGVCWPFRALYKLLRRFVFRPVGRGAAAVRAARLARTSRTLCAARLRLAARGLLLEERKKSDV